MNQFAKFWIPRVTIVFVGVTIGLAAKWASDDTDDSAGKRKFDDPVENPGGFDGKIAPPAVLEDFDLKLDGYEESDPSTVVPPLVIPDLIGGDQSLSEVSYADVLHGFEEHTHGDGAVFHAHGDEVCASGCAVSNHPTEKLDEPTFARLMQQFASQPMDESSQALEELLFYGPQTRQLLEKSGFEPLDRLRADFLWQQLKTVHAKISIRVVDETGEIRTWLDPTRVPFDRRHVFEMKVNQVQPAVCSGTVKRVGLYHLWTRL